MPASANAPRQVGPDCSCSSGSPYGSCCGPVHAGEAAATALALMRSRFSAFALGRSDHLLSSWHPDTRPSPRELDLDTSVEWRRLQIVDTVAGAPDDDEGVVEFRASFRRDGRAGLVHERSRFVRVDRRWVYLDGDPRET